MILMAEFRRISRAVVFILRIAMNVQLSLGARVRKSPFFEGKR